MKTCVDLRANLSSTNVSENPRKVSEGDARGTQVRGSEWGYPVPPGYKSTSLVTGYKPPSLLCCYKLTERTVHYDRNVLCLGLVKR